MFDFGVEYSEDLIDDREWVYTNITEDRIASILKVGSKKHSPPYIRRLYCMELFINTMIEV